MDVKPAASATSKELINQLFISLLEERAFYVRGEIDAIKGVVGADRLHGCR
jgi:hypothetical protein